MSRTSRSVPAPRRFSLESLESRQLMAGNVDFTLTNGNLFITGDNQGNGLQIRQIAPNQFALIGTKAGGANTTVQGAGFKVVSGVTGNVIMNMNGGNDAVLVEDGQGTFATLPGLPTTFQLPTFAKNLQVNMGAGQDTFTTDGMTVEGRMILDTGFGNEADTVQLSDVDVNAVNTGGLALEIDTQGGNDQLNIQDSVFRGLTDIDTGSEDDTLRFEDNFIFGGGNLVIRTQNGNDTVLLEDVVANSDLFLDTGFGDDFVDFGNVRVFDELDINLSFGNDAIVLEETVAKRAEIDGSVDTDVFFDLGDNDFGVLEIENFEIEL